jgi:protein-tyrosine phosphatase
MTQNFVRKHAFDDLQNFRDFGGYDTASRRRMAIGRFFRSANPAFASDDDLRRLAEMGLSHIVDLRRPDERQRNPARRWENFAAAVIQNDDEHEGDETWHGFMAESDLTAEAFRGYLNRYYRRAPHLPRHIDLFARYFDALADGDGALLVHCAAGKDRTGMIVALTHALAGVHEDDIFADFLLTNDPERFAKHGPVWAAAIEAEHGKRPTQEAMAIAMGVEADYLKGALDVIHESHGDVRTYLKDVLGVDEAKQRRIEKRLFD